MTSCENLAKNVQLTCSPLSALVDKKVRINVQGLEPNQKITLQAQLVGDVQDRYCSLANYIADDNGEVCLSTQPSVGGTYVGVEPMGFIWSLKLEPGQKAGRRLFKRDVTKPFLVDLYVLDGHLDNKDSSKPLCSLRIERHYMGAGVRRIQIREGRLRGILFLPPGEGPFQGVIYLHNSFGFLREDRSALLASNGIAALSLAYWGSDDLPKKLSDVEFEYFLEAVDWFAHHPMIRPGGIGVIGISSGAIKGLFLSAYCPKIAAMVWISGRHELSGTTMKYKGKDLDFSLYDSSKVKQLDDGSVSVKDCYPYTWVGDIKDDPKAIPVENMKGLLLLIYGTDDQCFHAELCASKIYERLKAFNKGAQCTMLGYHGAGHLLAPPYAPPTFTSYQKTMGVTAAWGGEEKAHAFAQEDAWSKSLTFLKENLPNKTFSNL